MVSTNRTWLEIEGNFRWARSHLWNLETKVHLAGKRERETYGQVTSRIPRLLRLDPDGYVICQDGDLVDGAGVLPGS
jgi:hypothetical protein